MIAFHPPMGWNSWDCYGAAVNEKIVRQNAEYMAKRLKPYGREYIVVDIQWYQPTAPSHEYEPFAELTMDEYGRLQPAPNRFPSSAGGQGFAPLAAYIHSLGLKFGIHIMRGFREWRRIKNCRFSARDMPAIRPRIPTASAHGIQICMGCCAINRRHGHTVTAFFGSMRNGALTL